MREFMGISKALSDVNRVRILMFLRGGELCLCQIIELLGLAPSTVSKHTAILYQADLVETRKEGRWIYYRHPINTSRAVRKTLRWLKEMLADDEVILKDDLKLKKIIKMPKEKLCVRYKRLAVG